MGTDDAPPVVPLTPLGLPPHHAFDALITSLLALDDAANEALERVSARVKQQKAELSELERRIHSGRERVQAIAGSSAATVVYSASRYPAPKRLPPFKRIFAERPRAELAWREAKDPPPPLETPLDLADVASVRESFSSVASSRVSLGTVQLTPGPSRDAVDDYQLALSLQKGIAARHVRGGEAEVAKGLGAAPADTRSLSELLLFNSTQNVYSDYRVVDNLSGEEAPRVSDAPTEDTALHEAPETVRFGDELPEVERIEYSYKPVLGDVPELDLPSMLPSLAHVADLNWTAQDLPSIAPSQLAFNAGKQLPTLIDEAEAA
eukprot:CAMPEP_0119368644 /NCGR_PEP_ID=MMETSP1334-20130426/15273_1 /TAXON_ID=127549 /ORGANISM="Calcidiscus leptoporus, Strain RCC1130" /LENGTH=320 /DNA_ID=CAMNT_0007385329 /DNA_START=74 /DNA_END=1032 /DNA_ORIENTATION=+